MVQNDSSTAENYFMGKKRKELRREEERSEECWAKEMECSSHNESGEQIKLWGN
jgi:hypothetical protein